MANSNPAGGNAQPGPWSQYATAALPPIPDSYELETRAPQAAEGPWTQYAANGTTPSGYGAQLEQGASDVLGGIGKTLDVHSSPGGDVNAAGKWLESKGNEIAPKDFVPADLTGKNGSLSNLGLWLARQAPAAGGALGGAVLASALAPEALAGAAATGGAAGTGWLMSAGNEAQEAAAKRTGNPNATPDAADIARGDLTAGAESAVASLPVTRYLPEASVLAKTGAAGAISALKKLAGTAVDQGAASAAADAAHQVGQSVGTPGGVQVNPAEIGGAAVGGAAGGALLGSPKTTQAVLDSLKYREITPDLQQPATQVANRVIQNAGGENLQGSLIRSGGAQRAGQAAVQKTGMDIHNELGSAVADLRSRVNLPVDAQNVLNAAMAGQLPTKSGYATLEAAVANDPQGANVVNLVRQAHAFDVLNESGHHAGGKFTGGLGGAFKHILSGEHVAKSALVGIGAAAFEEGAGHLIAYSPQVLGAAVGGAAFARTLDNITGAQAPAGRFVRNFQDPSVPIRQAVPQSPIAQAPQAEPSPFPRPVAGGKGSLPMLPPQIQAEMAARASLAKLAPQAASPEPEMNPLALPPDITRGARSLVRGQLLAQRLREGQQPASQPEPAVNPLALPKNITAPAANAMKGAAIAQRLKEAQAAQDTKANAVATPEPQAPVLNPMTLPASITGPAKSITRGAMVAQRLREASTMANPQPAPQAAIDPLALPASITGPARTLARGALLAQRMNEQGTKSAPAVRTHVSKVDANTATVKTGNGKLRLPVAPYSNLPIAEAAQRILSDRKAAGVPIENDQTYLAKIHSVLGSVRQKVAAVQSAAPSIPRADVAKFEGVRSQKAAISYRNHLAAEYPQAASALMAVFSDEAIAHQWSQ
jgi:hypothetical protein